MDFTLFLLFRNFLRLRFKFVVKVNALSCLTVRWRCGTHNYQINTLLCVSACHLLCWPYIQYLLGVRWFLYQVEICSVIILITRWTLLVCLQSTFKICNNMQTWTPKTRHLYLRVICRSQQIYPKVIFTTKTKYSARGFLKGHFLWQTATVKLQHSRSETLQMGIDCVHFFNLNISCSLVLKNWKKTFLTSWMCPSLRFCPVTHVKGIC